MPISWDVAKNLANREKHGISFEEVAELFTSGVDYLEIFDEGQSDDEDRFIAIGPVRKGLVVVVFVEEQEDDIRIISARWATKAEQVRYHSYMDQLP